MFNSYLMFNVDCHGWTIHSLFVVYEQVCVQSRLITDKMACGLLIGLPVQSVLCASIGRRDICCLQPALLGWTLLHFFVCIENKNNKGP